MHTERRSSITALAHAFRAGTHDPVAETESCLARIEALDGHVNAFVSVWREDAVASAARARDELRAGIDRGPLHGVPIALKDLIDTAGRRATYGSLAQPGDRPDRDAAIATKLSDAGAVVLGKTNLLEFAYGIVHPHFGQTNNPWDVGRTAGGSSGGSAAAVAAGMCLMAVGTDTGGSIRIPAAYCGVVGFKPSFGRLPLDGVFPLSWSLDHVGPITADAADLAAVWQVLADADPRTLEPAAGHLRLGVLRRYLTERDIAPSVASATNVALDRLDGTSATLTDVDVAHLDGVDRHLVAIVLPEATHVHRSTMARGTDGYAEGTLAQLRDGAHVPAVAYLEAQAFRRQLRDALDQALDGLDALVLPTAPWVAPREDPAIATDEGDAEGRRTAPFNLTGHPTVSVPIGTVDGLPIGLQVVGAVDADERVIAIARRIETALGPLAGRPT